jgi:hypothetical protein
VVIFTKARLDATAKGNAKSGQFQTAGAR